MLDPDDGLLAVDGDPHKAVLAALGKLEPGFGVITIYYGEGSTLDDAETLASGSRRRHRASRRSTCCTAASRTTGT